MELLVIGGSGYVGSEILYQAHESGISTAGTYCSERREGMLHFQLENYDTWQNVREYQPDVLIWAASSSNDMRALTPFEEFLALLPKTKFVYISSDIVLCKRALASDAPIGEYARRKQAEAAAILAKDGSAIFTTGPIYGKTSQGRLDKRTAALLENHDTNTHRYWQDVYKTFVPVIGLATTLLTNLTITGHHYIGPPVRISYFDFYVSRMRAHNLATSAIQATTISDAELTAMSQCRDISYGEKLNRLWHG